MVERDFRASVDVGLDVQQCAHYCNRFLDAE